MYSDGLLKLPIFTIQKNFKILLTVYSLSPLFLLQFMTAPYYNYGLEPNRAKKQGLPAKVYPPADMAVNHSLCSSP